MSGRRMGEQAVSEQAMSEQAMDVQSMNVQTMSGPFASQDRGDVVSRPVYGTLHADETGRSHVVIADRRAHEALARFVAQATDRCVDLATVVLLDDEQAQGGDQDARHLHEALAQADMGVRLYLLGPEHRIWPLARLARTIGLEGDAIRLWSAGRASRPVFCVHCRTRTTGCTRSVVRCPGCARALGVRDHFSRELGAYLGVQIDAETPGRVPAGEELAS